MTNLDHRQAGYAMLAGQGLEVGALNEPAALPPTAIVRYLDAIDEFQAAALFPELAKERLVKVSFIGDLDQGDLRQFADESFDFVVANHVLEHLRWVALQRIAQPAAASRGTPEAIARPHWYTRENDP